MSASKISNSKLLDDGGLPKGGKGGGKEKDESTSGHPERSASPEVAKCAICLGDVVNRSYSNSCAHQFCFGCLLEWSKVKPECPLCKSSFRSIYHNFRSTTDYDEYVVPTPVPHLSIRFTASGANYRLSPFIRVLEARAGHHQHSPLAHAFEGVSIPPGMFQPPPTPVVVSTNPFNNGSSGLRPEFFGDFINEHRRVQEEAVQMPGYQNRRRRYDRNEWVQPFGSTLQPGSVIFPSVEYIRSHPSALSRLRNWLYRELNVLLGLYRSRDQMAFVYDLIMHLINHYDVRSRDFRDMVNTYFGTKTSHFQHELYHFILSGMSMEEYDRVAEYPSTSSGGRASGRRNAAPEIITLDSEDEGSNPNLRRPLRQNTGNADVILLDVSSDEDDSSGRRNPYPPSATSGSDSRYNGSAAQTNGSTSNNLIARSNQGSLSLVQESTLTMPDLDLSVVNDRIDDREGARRRFGNAGGIDPDMPVLEPQIFPYVTGENFSFGGTTIDRSRATAATTTVITSSSNSHASSLPSDTTRDQNLSRPTVLSNTNGRLQSATNDIVRLMESDFDIDFNVSVESYASPPRQVSRPLASPDFPILQLRRNMSERESWEHTSRAATVGSSGGSCPFASFASNRSSSSRGNDNTSAFVPYESESLHQSRDELARPPRPSCIHSSASLLSHSNHRIPSASAASREFGTLSPAPAFRIDLYPRGMSSSQVMDLSRSAGLISNPLSSRTTTTTSARSPECPTVLVPSAQTPPLPGRLTSMIPPAVASTSAAASKQERRTDSPEGQADSDELECLGSFPIQKKPPLAVITLSSDDEEESRVKAENKRERLNILSSDEDATLLDGFMNWSQQFSSDLNLLEEEPPSPPVIDFQSSSSSSSFLPLAPPPPASSVGLRGTTTSNSSSAVISIPTIPSFRLTIRNNSNQTATESNAAKQPSASTSDSSERHRKKHKSASPKKSKSKRSRVLSSSSDSSDNEDSHPPTKRVQPRLSPAKLPKKRKYTEFQESPKQAASLSTSESSDGSDLSTDSENDDSSDSLELKRLKGKSSSSRKRSSSKKKHKSKSKRSKKSKKSKEKDKSRKSSSSRRSGSKVKSNEPTGNSIFENIGNSSSTASSSRHSRVRVKTKKGSSGACSSAKSTVQAPTTSSSASFTLSSTPVMNMPDCDFEYPSGLLDLSFNSRTEDDTPMMPLLDDDSTTDFRIPAAPPSTVTEPLALESTVDTSALFDSPPRSYAFWDDYSSSSFS